MPDMTTMVLEKEIQNGAVSVPLRRRFMGVVAHTLAMVSPGLPRPKSCSCGYPMDLRGDLLLEEDIEMMVEGVRFWNCSRCGDSVKERYCFPSYKETM